MSTSDHSSTPDSGVESAKTSPADDPDTGATPGEATSPEPDAVPPKGTAKNRRRKRKRKDADATDAEASDVEADTGALDDADGPEADAAGTGSPAKDAKAKGDKVKDAKGDKTKATKDKTSKTKTAKGKAAAVDTDDKATAKKSRTRGARPQAVPGLNPTWWAPVMCGLMIVGLLWIVVFYLLSDGTQDTFPIPGIGYGNLAIGFGLIMAGFLMTTRWK